MRSTLLRVGTCVLSGFYYSVLRSVGCKEVQGVVPCVAYRQTLNYNQTRLVCESNSSAAVLNTIAFHAYCPTIASQAQPLLHNGRRFTAIYLSGLASLTQYFQSRYSED